MEELAWTDTEYRRAKITGFFQGIACGASLMALVAVIVIAFGVRPANAATSGVDTTGCNTTFTYNHKTGDVTVRAQKVFDPHPIYKFRFVMADDLGHLHFDDYPRADVGHFTSTYTRNIATLKGGNLWALIAFRGSDACGKGVMFGGVA